MIRLLDSPRPPELTDELIKALTEKFKQTGESVWKKPFITKGLLDISHQKCAFSECKLVEEGKYMEVEHFHPKSLYPDEVVKWENLLPINSACNKAKLNHDTKQEPIVNPRYENPQEHLYFQGYRFKPKTEKGELTIRVLNLNDRSLWVNKRYEIGIKAVEELEEIREKLLDYGTNTQRSVSKQNKIVSALRNLFLQGTPKAEYSAVVASYLLNDDDFKKVKTLMQEFDLWDEEFDELEKQLRFCALEVH